MKNILSYSLNVLEGKERQKLAWLIMLDILVSIVDIVSLAFLLLCIKFYIDPGYSIPYMPSSINDHGSLLLIALALSFFILKNIAAYFVTKVQYSFIASIATRISTLNLWNYQRSPFAEFVNTDSSRFIRMIGFQPFEFCQYILSGYQQIITQVILVTLTIIAILVFNASLFLVLMLVLIPPATVIFVLIRKKVNKMKKDIRDSNEDSFRYLLDGLKGYVEGNVYGRNDFFLNRFTKHRKIFSNNLFDSLAIQSFPSRIIEIFAVGGLFVLISLSYRAETPANAVLHIGVFMAAAYKIIPGLVKLINITGQIRAYEYTVEELNKKAAVDTEPVLSDEPVNSIEFRNIYFSYGGKSVLRNFNCRFSKEELIGITGESGIGKTTIFNLLLGFLGPSTGDILINDKIRTAGKLKSLWPSIAYVRQQVFLIHDTLEKNITLSDQPASPEQLKKAICISGLHEFVNSMPEGVNTMIAENGKNISGGQQQRIAIARALYKNADLILLDEPFNELDESSVMKLTEHLEDLRSQGKIILLITHDKSILRHCSKTIDLNE